MLRPTPALRSDNNNTQNDQRQPFEPPQTRTDLERAGPPFTAQRMEAHQPPKPSATTAMKIEKRMLRALRTTELKRGLQLARSNAETEGLDRFADLVADWRVETLDHLSGPARAPSQKPCVQSKGHTILKATASGSIAQAN